MDAAKGPDSNAATSQKFPSGIKQQPEHKACVQVSAPWACVVTVEDQKNAKEEGNEEWGKNWEIGKDTKEKRGNAEGREEEKCRRKRAFLLF